MTIHIHTGRLNQNGEVRMDWALDPPDGSVVLDVVVGLVVVGLVVVGLVVVGLAVVGFVGLDVDAEAALFVVLPDAPAVVVAEAAPVVLPAFALVVAAAAEVDWQFVMGVVHNVDPVCWHVYFPPVREQ